MSCVRMLPASRNKMNEKIAILFQADLPPIKNGIQKPMKSGGYSDSGADIACELYNNNVRVITPIKNPRLQNNKDWVFPDTKSGIEDALKIGATIFWLNTVLYKNHPIENYFNEEVQFIGQKPELVDIYDDKFYTNKLLKANGLPIPKTTLIEKGVSENVSNLIDFPFVIKPLRGRGSQGVFLVNNKKELNQKLKELFAANEFGNSLYIEKYLSGQEITVTVMPKGEYCIKNKTKDFNSPWCLPAVKRSNHINGIAPYNGVVAVMENSAVLTDMELNSNKIQEVYFNCITAAELIKIKAPIRIDCRANEKGEYFLFDLNMKPNMTGPSRSHRKNQDSLTLLAARKIGWNYFDLLNNMLNQKWKASR